MPIASTQPSFLALLLFAFLVFFVGFGGGISIFTVNNVFPSLSFVAVVASIALLCKITVITVTHFEAIR